MIAVLNIWFDDNSGDIEADRRRIEEHAKQIARRLTDDEPRVDQAEFVGFLASQNETEQDELDFVAEIAAMDEDTIISFDQFPEYEIERKDGRWIVMYDGDKFNFAHAAGAYVFITT